jgi:lipid II:glycine glycyltransferase (peptidoglycan interpeptide bridge formation enzyme)
MTLRVSWRRQLTRAAAAELDAFVDRSPYGHYAQTAAWARASGAGRPFSCRFVHVRDGDRLIATAVVLRGVAGGLLPLPYAKVERGPVVAELADLPRAIAALVRIARRRAIARLSVMPYACDGAAADVEAVLDACGFRRTQRFDGAHSCTLRLALWGRSERDLFAGGERRGLRGEISKADKLGVTARRGTAAELAILAALHTETMVRQDKSGRSPAFYAELAPLVERGERAALFIAEHAGVAHGALLVARHAGIATLVMAATSSERTAYTKTVLPLVLAIRWARDAGCAVFDFGGIPEDADTDAKRRSIAEYKLKFVRTRVALVGEHARWG